MGGRARLRFRQQISHMIIRHTNISAMENHHMPKLSQLLTKAETWGVFVVDVSPVAAAALVVLVISVRVGRCSWTGTNPRYRCWPKSDADIQEA